ncbi:5' exonuclease Apollo isoform X2 [Phalaenopsis equestris]|uniref:5' exonuclease Apollo isoform X2 n=1 Tax=Phalaenopsis equestris TaxID=78828 RepID=UPI0009E59911|nr:5' exonuclease Apollo isoform X2 [Phalaenopsis equestris]
MGAREREMEKGLVSIDRWGDGSQAYFLTHLHTDHTSGLSSKWSRGTLFCSATSAELLSTKFPDFDLSLIRVLEVGVTQLVLLRSPSSGSEVRLLVTPIDAHHCPGAVMYLFRGEFGCVLHTGDFRWEIMNERAVMAKKTFMDALEGSKIDILYLDNTYCHPSFSFPTREVASQQVIDIINSNPDHEVIIGIDTLGKEDLLLHISQALGMKIWVWPERLKTMHLLKLNSNFTTNTSLTRVRAVPRYSLTHETLSSLNTFHPTIGILPSGLPWRSKFLEKTPAAVAAATNLNDKTPLTKLHQYAFSVQYSDHSCFSEIQEFIRTFRPSKAAGLVSSSSYCINPRYYFSHLYENHHIRDVSCKDFRSKLDRKFEYEQRDNFVCKREKLSSLGGRVGAIRKGKLGAKIAEGEESEHLIL